MIQNFPDYHRVLDTGEFFMGQACRNVLRPSSIELSKLVHTISQRIARHLERHGATTNLGHPHLLTDLVDWTGRGIRSDKSGSIPAHLEPVLQRLHLQPATKDGSAESFRETVFFGGWIQRQNQNAGAEDRS